MLSYAFAFVVLKVMGRSDEGSGFKFLDGWTDDRLAIRRVGFGELVACNLRLSNPIDLRYSLLE